MSWNVGYHDVVMRSRVDNSDALEKLIYSKLGHHALRFKKYGSWAVHGFAVRPSDSVIMWAPIRESDYCNADGSHRMAITRPLPLFGDHDVRQIDYLADPGILIEPVDRKNFGGTAMFEYVPWVQKDCPIRPAPNQSSRGIVTVAQSKGITAPKGEVAPGQKFQLCELWDSEFGTGPYIVYAVDRDIKEITIGPFDVDWAKMPTTVTFRGMTPYTPRIEGFQIQRIERNGASSIRVGCIDRDNWARPEGHRDYYLFTGSHHEQQRVYPKFSELTFSDSPSYSRYAIDIAPTLIDGGGKSAWLKNLSMDGGIVDEWRYDLKLLQTLSYIKPHQEPGPDSAWGDRDGCQSVLIEQASTGHYGGFKGRATAYAIRGGYYGGGNFPAFHFINSHIVDLFGVSLEGNGCGHPAQIIFEDSRFCDLHKMSTGTPVAKYGSRTFGDGVLFKRCSDCNWYTRTGRIGANEWLRRTDAQYCDNPGQNACIRILQSDRVKCRDVFLDAPDIETVNVLLQMDGWSNDHGCTIEGYFAKNYGGGDVQWVPYAWDHELNEARQLPFDDDDDDYSELEDED